MSITLADGTTTITLDDDLFWQDELNWQPVEQTTQRSLTGALIVSAKARLAGRPITLSPPDESSGLTLRSALLQIQAWAAVPLKQMTLHLRGVPFVVVFRHQDGAVEAKPFIDFSDALPTDYYLATLRFMEVSP